MSSSPSATQSSSAASRRFHTGVLHWGHRIVIRLSEVPPRWVEILLWVLVAGSAIGIRLYLAKLSPVIFWSDDAGSYSKSAFGYLHTGEWVTDPRRGAIYSLIFAGAIKIFGSFHALMYIQHLLGLSAVLGSAVCLRIAAGRKAIVPLALCAYAYGVFSAPLELEHTVRNDSVLFILANWAICSWFLSLYYKAPAWLWVTGISIALLSLIKNVFLPFAPVAILGAVWCFREDPRLVTRQLLYFILALGIPFVAIKTFSARTMKRPPAPQGGILLYGRTAQFTLLHEGKYPELKKAIREDIEAYRALPKLDNNIILKRTAVPKIQQILAAEEKDARDLNRVCRELALEAIAANPWAYFKQILADLKRLQFDTVNSPKKIRPRSIVSMQRDLKKIKSLDPYLEARAYIKALDTVKEESRFYWYNKWIGTSWLFRRGSVFLTTCLLPLFIWRARQPRVRLWWIGLASVWFFTLLLLCTIGRPLNRYMMPVFPVMFWTLASAAIFAWAWAVKAISSYYNGRHRSFLIPDITADGKPRQQFSLCNPPSK